MDMDKILVTGFSNFGNSKDNPSERLVYELKHQRPEINVRIFKGYKDIDQSLESALNKYRPKVVLMFGLASRTPFVRLERVAKRPSKAKGKKLLNTTLPLKNIHDTLSSNGIVVDYSSDAGSYWCNYIFYKTCQLRKRDKDSVHGFIHIPNPAKYEKTFKKPLELTNLGLLTLDILSD